MFKIGITTLQRVKNPGIIVFPQDFVATGDANHLVVRIFRIWAAIISLIIHKYLILSQGSALCINYFTWLNDYLNDTLTLQTLHNKLVWGDN